MRLNASEQAMLAGECGEACRMALAHQLEVGRFFGAEDFVEVTQAHVMADTESLGEAGVRWLESLADADQGAAEKASEGATASSGAGTGVRVPTITDPRGTDFAQAEWLGHQGWMLDLERRTIAALTRLGVAMTDTCIHYQTVSAPVHGEHVAYGDTGVVIYTNSVCGARSNYEGGPSALAAGLTGRTPRYGFHLPAQRRATLRLRTDWTPQTLNEWGALGAVIGRQAGHYWAVPVLEGLESVPGSDALKHFGAAMASFGSVALFHLVGITPEAPTLQATGGDALTVQRIGRSDVEAVLRSHVAPGPIDVVVFSAPQLSLFELRTLARLCEGRRFRVPLLAVTSPQVKPDADRLGYSARIEAAGGTVLSGMCFYQSYAREMAAARGWWRLATNSTKMVNILGGYGYEPHWASMEACVQAAETGVLA